MKMNTLARFMDLAALLLPRSAREDWKREWKAEVWHRRASLHRRGALDPVARADLALRVLGAVRDALAVRRAALDGDAAASGTLTMPLLRAAAAVVVLALATALPTLGFAAARSVGRPFPALLVAAAAAVTAALLAAGGSAAAGVMEMGREMETRRPRIVRDPSTSPRARRFLLAALGGAAGLTLVVVLLRHPPTDGVAALGGRMGAGAVAFHAAASLAAGAVLVSRVFRSPAG
jgi:hypothetical protein